VRDAPDNKKQKYPHIPVFWEGGVTAEQNNFWLILTE
jgi:hypothetical protein